VKLIISDSTTIITLLNIGRLDILKNIFSAIYIPPKVYQEITVKEKIALDKEFFIQKEIKDKKLYKLLSKELNLSLIIDEKKGRKVASIMGINIFGFIGLLIINYKKGFLSKNEAIKVFNSAKEQGFRVGKNLENDFLKLLK
jgi:predicted nucleic acid-binding protein